MTAPATAVAAVLAGGPVVGRLHGGQLARRELARPIYHPSLASRLGTDLVNWLRSLELHGLGGQNWLATTLLVTGIVALLGAAGYITGSARLDRRYRSPVIGSSPVSAAEHRSASDRFATAGDYQSAIIERVRAIAVDLESRQILPVRPGRTAAEFGEETALAIPAEATALAAATRLFDDVRYGGRLGTANGYQQVRDLDLRIQAVPIQVSATR